MHLSRTDFEKAVQEALASIPQQFEPYMESLVVDVEDRPSRELLAEMEIDDETELLGLYHGTPLTERSVEWPPMLPDRVTIYQRNLEAICRTRQELVHEIRATVLHEVGHHFGMDEEDLDELGFG